MKSVNGITKLVAAATALSVTFAMVWSIASFGHPAAPEIRVQLAAASQPTSWYIDVR